METNDKKTTNTRTNTLGRANLELGHSPSTPNPLECFPVDASNEKTGHLARTDNDIRVTIHGEYT